LYVPEPVGSHANRLLERIVDRIKLQVFLYHIIGKCFSRLSYLNKKVVWNNGLRLCLVSYVNWKFSGGKTGLYIQNIEINLLVFGLKTSSDM